ncbi:MAG: hypothetical protein MN733_21340 [Nitrososphaera sp.]|nr:hypothetical protein [Nitrososphaera sp.]
MMSSATQSGTGPSPYRRQSRTGQSELVGLAAWGSDQFQKVCPTTKTKGLRGPRDVDLVVMVSAISGQGLLGSPALREPVKHGTPAAELISMAEFFQIDQRRGRVHFGRRAPTTSWLSNALQELDQVDEEAAEEGLPLSNQLCKRNAKNILKNLTLRKTPAPTVYPTENGAIAILFQHRETRTAVLILCEPDGSGACFATSEGKKRRARYDDASDLPDEFVMSQLQLLPAV